jgi:hypothetical protein
LGKCKIFLADLEVRLPRRYFASPRSISQD